MQSCKNERGGKYDKAQSLFLVQTREYGGCHVYWINIQIMMHANTVS